MRFNDAIIGVLLIVFAIAEIVYTRTFPSLHGQNYGPALFPVLIGLALAGCGVLLVIKGLLIRRPGKQSAADVDGYSWVDLANVSKSQPARLNALLIVLIPLMYVLLSDVVGFIPIAFAAMLILLFRLGSSWPVAIVVAGVCTGVIQILFAKVLLVPLPAGWLQGYI